MGRQVPWYAKSPKCRQMQARRAGARWRTPQNAVSRDEAPATEYERASHLAVPRARARDVGRERPLSRQPCLANAFVPRAFYTERDHGSRGIPVADAARHRQADGPAAPGSRRRAQPTEVTMDADVRPALGGRRTPVWVR